MFLLFFVSIIVLFRHFRIVFVIVSLIFYFIILSTLFFLLFSPSFIDLSYQNLVFDSSNFSQVHTLLSHPQLQPIYS